LSAPPANRALKRSPVSVRKAGGRNGFASVKENAVVDECFQRKVSKDNSPYFVLLAANGQTLGKSEMYSSSKAMEGGIASVKANAPGAPTKVLEEK
jgi:uncharacterized protein YegP (UPF0339 family)